jgi:hypothetical protein
VEDVSHYLKDSLHYPKDSLDYLKDSLHYLKEASHRRFRPRSARKRLLPCVQDGAPYVEGGQASRFRLVAVVFCVKDDVKEVVPHRSRARSSRSKGRQYRDGFLHYV